MPLVKLVVVAAVMIFSLKAYSQNQLVGKVSNFTAFFTEDDKIRHARWEFSGKQTANFGLRLTTVVEGRLWWDTALMDNEYAARQDYSDRVRDDELFDGEARSLYFDYLGDFFRIKAGRMVIDWTGAASPATVDMLTPVDVRHGVSYSTADLIVPVNAISVSHNFLFEGTLEWLLVPEGEHHRLAKGINGYGYYEYLLEQVRPRSLVLTEKEIPSEEDEIEFGMRYQATLAGVDFTLLGYRGHQRSPSFLINPSERTVEIEQYFPRVNTFGTSFAYAADALVTRLLLFYEPRRELRVKRDSDDFSGDVHDHRAIAGLGFDWVFSRHLKFYSEQYYTFNETRVGDDPTEEEEAIEGFEEDYVGAFKLTNESFENVIISLEGLFTAPENSQIVTPQIEFAFWDNYKLIAGARLFEASSEDARYYTLRNSSYYFARLESQIDVGNAFKD